MKRMKYECRKCHKMVDGLNYGGLCVDCQRVKNGKPN
jgi:hypothetical protein